MSKEIDHRFTPISEIPNASLRTMIAKASDAETLWRRLSRFLKRVSPETRNRLIPWVFEWNEMTKGGGALPLEITKQVVGAQEVQVGSVLRFKGVKYVVVGLECSSLPKGYPEIGSFFKEIPQKIARSICLVQMDLIKFID